MRVCKYSKLFNRKHNFIGIFQLFIMTSLKQTWPSQPVSISYNLHSFFFIRINFIRILRLKIAKEQWKFKNKQSTSWGSGEFQVFLKEKKSVGWRSPTRNLRENMGFNCFLCLFGIISGVDFTWNASLSQ